MYLKIEAWIKQEEINLMIEALDLLAKHSPEDGELSEFLTDWLKGVGEVAA